MVKTLYLNLDVDPRIFERLKPSVGAAVNEIETTATDPAVGPHLLLFARSLATGGSRPARAMLVPQVERAIAGHSPEALYVVDCAEEQSGALPDMGHLEDIVASCLGSLGGDVPGAVLVARYEIDRSHAFEARLGHVEVLPITAPQVRDRYVQRLLRAISAAFPAETEAASASQSAALVQSLMEEIDHR